MPLFGGPSKKSFLGVDIGTGGIKVAELSVLKGRFHLETYGYSENPSDQLAVSPLEQPEKTGAFLSQLCKEAGVTSKIAIAALPVSQVFSTVLSVPQQKDPRLMKEAIHAQARKLAPMPLEEMITYSTFVDDPQADPKREHVRVLVTGSAKTLVQKYMQIFKTAKLELQALDTESFALIRSLIGKDKNTMMVVDVGAVRTNITIVEKGVPFFTRSIQTGGRTVTEELARQVGVSVAEAEQMKSDVSAAPTAGGKIAPSVAAVADAILNEIRYSIEWYGRMDLTESRAIQKLILCGGSASLPGLDTYLAEALDVNVYVGDPWARVVYPEVLRPVLDEIGPRFAVAVGLAMRESASV